MSGSTRLIEVLSLLVAMAGLFIAADSQIEKANPNAPQQKAPTPETARPPVKPEHQEKPAAPKRPRTKPERFEPKRQSPKYKRRKWCPETWRYDYYVPYYGWD